MPDRHQRGRSLALGLVSALLLVAVLAPGAVVGGQRAAAGASAPSPAAADDGPAVDDTPAPSESAAVGTPVPDDSPSPSTPPPPPGEDPSPSDSPSPSESPTTPPSPSGSPAPSESPSPTANPTASPAPSESAAPSASPSPTPAPTPSPTLAPSDSLRLVRLRVVRGSIAPKSIVATQTGLFFAQNMMYRHTITVYNRKGELVKTISDRVVLARFGYSRWPDPVRGAPVEAAVAPDGKHVYVSQYSMYGPGFRHPGWDTGWVDDVIDRSFVYEISTSTFRKTRVFRVGQVPKAVAVSPDGRWLLAGNWTHRDVSVVDLAKGREVRRIVVGGNPRGIAFTADSSTVYLSAESGQRILRYDFATGRLTTLIPLLRGEPRHLVIDPAGRYLYASLNKGGGVVKIDIGRRRVVDRVSTGRNPRTIVLAPDGRSLYVVNYESQTLAKVRTRDMLVIQRLRTAGVHPIGVDYDARSRTVWVACYRGTIERFADR